MSDEVIEKTKDAVLKVQQIKPESVAREAELGKPFALHDAVAPLARLVRLFQQIPVQYVGELPEAQAAQLQTQANSLLSRVRELDEFDPATVDNPTAKRANLIEQLEGAYPTVFGAIWHHIGYLSSRERDFAAMETEARASIEAVKQEASNITTALKEQKVAAEGILSDIKQVAAETGVS